jgi:cysteine desulfurase / selenocysteine lyase
MIYLDNAATSWPKPPEVFQAMRQAMEQSGGNPGRSGHRLSVAAARVQYDCREKIAELYNAPDPLRVIFSPNATQAINLVLKGYLKPGDRVVTTSMEHNAVMRPLRSLEKMGVSILVSPCAGDGSLDLTQIAGLIDSDTRLVILNHASNVTGTILPIAGVTSLAHRYGALVLVDAAQAAGAIPVDVQASGIDLLAFTGHKELLGPTGTGGLVIGRRVDAQTIDPLICGGTGSRSDEDVQPEDLPDKFESGTANLVGIAGLSAGLSWIKERGLAEIRDHAQRLTTALIEGLSDIPRVKVYGTQKAESALAIVSFTVQGKKASEVGFRLDEEYGILVRVGLHCAPAAHKTLGTFPEGTVRLSPGIFTTMEEIHETLKAVRQVARS